TAPATLPEALVDLRDIHSVPRAVLEALIAQGKRVASLLSPYREHLAQHLAVTSMRVALPEPYATQPRGESEAASGAPWHGCEGHGMHSRSMHAFRRFRACHPPLPGHRESSRP